MEEDGERTVEILSKEQRRFHERAATLEHMMSYMWTGKDVGWYLGSPYLAYPCAFLAMICSTILMLHAMFHKYFATALNLFCVSMWLCGNFVWMRPEVPWPDEELHNQQWHNDYDYYTMLIFLCCIGLILLQLLVLGPLQLVKDPVESSDLVSSYHESLGLTPSFIPKEVTVGYGAGPCHAEIKLDWARYEHLHFLWWVLKDLSWVSRSPVLWCVSVFFTIIISVDFIVTTSMTGNEFEALHYLGMAFWLSGNVVWSFGEVWGIGNDRVPEELFNWREAHTCRYWACVLVLLSIVPYMIAHIRAALRTHRERKRNNKGNSLDEEATTPSFGERLGIRLRLGGNSSSNSASNSNQNKNSNNATGDGRSRSTSIEETAPLMT